MRKLPFHSPSPSWPKLLGAAAIGATAGVLIHANFYTEGKRLKQMIRAPYDIGDDQFRRSVSHLLNAPLLGGNRVTALHNGAQVFPAMLAAIRSAQHSISFENFIFSTGVIARQFAEALAERARAGVKVHMLQDALGADDIHGEETDLMEAAGVELEVYRFLHLTKINVRTHRKLLVVDGKVGFTGGTGIADVWMGHGHKPNEWRDSHFRLEGPGVAQMQEAFLDNWMMTRGCVLHGDKYFPPLEPVGTQLCQTFKSSADEGSDSTRLVYLLSIAAARRTIRIANAYFLPDELIMEALIDAQKRGVKVEIIVPGWRTDQPFTRKVGRFRWGKLLRHGIRMWEFEPTNFHCKYFIADDQWVSVGSTNLDARSLVYNEECNLNILDEAFGREMVEVFEDDKRYAHEVTYEMWLRRPFSEKFIGFLGQPLYNQL